MPNYMTILLQKRCLLANLHKCKTLTSVKDYIFIKDYYQGRRKQCEAAGAVISKGHLLLSHHFSERQYLLKLYCIDTRLLVAIMGQQTSTLI
jgi:hypothetical protein